MAAKALIHIVHFYPAYDYREEDAAKPAGARRGQHPVDGLWVVKGPKGAVQFKLTTGWAKEMVSVPDPKMGWGMGPRKYEERSRGHIMPVDLGYHSPKRMYKGQSLPTKSCEILDGGPCYYDGSTLNAEEPFSILVNEGGEKLWKFLDDYYHETFGTKGNK